MTNKIMISGFADEIDNDFEMQLKTVKQLGMTHICLRSAYGKNICDYTLEEVQNLILPLLNIYEIKVSSLGSPIGKIFADNQAGFSETLKSCYHTAKIAQMLDCRFVRIFSFYIPKGTLPDTWRDRVIAQLYQIVDIFSSTGIVAIHENEKDIYGDTALRCKDLMDSIQSPFLKMAFDFANFVQCGEDPEVCYQLLKPYVAYFHIKDAVKNQGINVVCGTGQGKVEHVLRKAILEDGYQGFLTLEPHLVQFEMLQSLELTDAKEIIRENQFETGSLAYEAQYKALVKILNTL